MVGHSRLTTGLYSILWSLDNYEKIIIHGFDFFQNSKGHYYDNILSKTLNRFNIIKRGKKHNNKTEKQFVNNLIKNNKVVTLNTFIKNIKK